MTHWPYIHWTWLILTVFVSAWLGMLLMGLLAAVSREDVQRCVNCKHYAYYDGPLCGLRESEGWLWEIRQPPEEWHCADWEATE